MIRVASPLLALLLTSLALVASIHPADARSRGQHHAARHHRASGERTATNDKPLNGASADLDRTLNGRIKSICRGC
jgi:hypothetical protein